MVGARAPTIRTGKKMDKDEKQAVGVVALAAPFLPFAYFGIPILLCVIAYSLGSGMQSFLSLPAWTLGVTAAALAAGTVSCILGRMKGIFHAPLAALLLIFVSGIVQMNRSMLEIGDTPSTPGGMLPDLSDIAGHLISELALALPWILAVVVIAISTSKVHAYFTLRKSVDKKA
jgi:hypothetical protein